MLCLNEASVLPLVTGVLVGEGAEEHFAAVVSNALNQLSQHGHMLAHGTELRAALSGGDNMLLLELEPEAKDNLLAWAQAHAVLLQVFGPREQMVRLRRAHANEHHFAKLAQYAGLAHDLQFDDEAYFSPLRNLEEFQRELHKDAAAGRAALVRRRIVVD